MTYAQTIAEWSGASAVQYESREAWLRGRSAGGCVGGSDIAKILGIARWGSAWDVWARHAGVPLPERQDDGTLARGHRLERLVLSDYAAAHPDLVVEYLDNLKIYRGWMSGSPDAAAVPAENLRNPAGGVEVKTDGYSGWDDRWAAESMELRGWPTGEPPVPAYYAVQCYWYLGIAVDCDWWDLAVWVPRYPNLVELRVYRLHRDDDTIDALIDRVGEWRERHIVRGIEPDIDGSAACRAALRERFRPAGKTRQYRRATLAEDGLARRYAAAKRAKAKAEATLRKAGNELRDAIGDDRGLVLDATAGRKSPRVARTSNDQLRITGL